MLNHFANVCRQEKNTALALISHDKNEGDAKTDLLCLDVTPLFSDEKSGKQTCVRVLPDTGANICLAGCIHMRSMGIPTSNLQSCKRSVKTAGGFCIKTFGYVNILFKLNDNITIQPVYFSTNIKQFYLSKEACIKLKILPIGFPHCHTVKSINCDVVKDDSNEKSKILPKRPTNIPYPPTEENIANLEDYLKQTFAASTFNQQPPFPAMSNTLPAKIHLKGTSN